MRKTTVKVWLAVLVMVVVVSPLLADYGIRLGLNQPFLHNSGPYNFTQGNLNACKIGIFKSFRFSVKFELLTEINLSNLQNHFGETIRDPDTSGGKLIGLRYLEIPLLFKYGIPLKNELKLFLLAGPYVAMRVSENIPLLTVEKARQSLNKWYHSYNNYDTYPSNSLLYGKLKPFQGGLVFGLGMEHGPLIFDVRFTFGLTSYYSDYSNQLFANEWEIIYPGEDRSAIINSKINTFSMLFGIRF
jgi:hypothetical protein